MGNDEWLKQLAIYLYLVLSEEGPFTYHTITLVGLRKCSLYNCIRKRGARVDLTELTEIGSRITEMKNRSHFHFVLNGHTRK